MSTLEIAQKALAGLMAEAGFAVPSSNRDEQWDAPVNEAASILGTMLALDLITLPTPESRSDPDPTGQNSYPRAASDEWRDGSYLPIDATPEQVAERARDADRRAIAEVIEDRLDSHRQDVSTCSCGQWTPYGPTGTTFRWHVARDVAAHLTALTDLSAELIRKTNPDPRPCARYFGSDGTLCATHNGRFSTPSATRCERAAAALEEAIGG